MTEFLKELTRRKVWLFGGIYLALGWILLQVAIAIETTLALPGWVDQITLVFLTLGFPVALLLAWAQESKSGTIDPGKANPAARAEKLPSFSLAVLPFDNLTEETKWNGLANGLSEDIITLLNGYLGLNITGRNTSFQFKGEAIDLRDIGEKLNVRYVLEGSVRRVGDDLRITAQLINTQTGDHAWADRYDYPVATINKDQDEIIDKIFINVGDVTMVREVQRLRREPVETLTGDEIANIGDYLFTKQSRKYITEGIELLKSAVEKQPGSAMAHAYLARGFAQLPAFGLGDRKECRTLSLREIAMALDLAAGDPTVLACVAMASQFNGDMDKALSFAEEAIALGPKNPMGYVTRGNVRRHKGNFEESLADFDTVLSLISSGSPAHHLTIRARAQAHFCMAHYQEAHDLAEQSLMRDRTNIAFIISIASLGHLGRKDEAARIIVEYLKWWPEATLATVEESERTYQTSEDYLGRLFEGLTLAGFE